MSTVSPSAKTGAVPAIASAAVVGEPKRGRLRKLFGACLKAPTFFWLFFVYIAIELIVTDVRAVFLSVRSYHLAWVEVLYLSATVIAMAELLRVSRPGIDNTKEAVLMLLVGIVYLVAFVLGTAGVEMFAIFNNTEFSMLLMISWTQVILAFKINARTLKRTIDYTGGGE